MLLLTYIGILVHESKKRLDHQILVGVVWKPKALGQLQVCIPGKGAHFDPAMTNRLQRRVRTEWFRESRLWHQ